MTSQTQQAIARYRSELEEALEPARNEVRAAALEDADEFLADAVSAMDAGRLASERAAYDRFVEQFGTPSQLAASYLDETTPVGAQRSGLLGMCRESKSGSWGLFAFYMAVAVWLAAGRGFAEPDEPPKVSPFTEVTFHDDVIFVTFKDRTYQWLGLDEKPVADIAASAREQFGERWQKRVAEDLVEVLWGMDYEPADRVMLRLKDVDGGVEVVVSAEMTEENRQAIYLKRNEAEIEAVLRKRAFFGTEAPKLSPFTDVTFGEDAVVVVFDDKEFEWAEINGVRVRRIIAFAKGRYGDRWQKRVAEDLVEVLWGMGLKPKRQVELVLVDPATGGEETVSAEMTEENRRAIWTKRNGVAKGADDLRSQQRTQLSWSPMHSNRCGLTL